MLYVIESTKPLDRVADDLEPHQKFGILGAHNLKESMAKKRVAKRVLDTNLEVSTAPPCRISLCAVSLALCLPSWGGAAGGSGRGGVGYDPDD